MSEMGMDRRKRPLWNRILRLLEQDLAERRSTKVVVEVHVQSDSYQKEIGELSRAELRSLDSSLREHVLERLLDRYLAEQGYVDLLRRAYAYTKKIEDLIPADLPALIETDREKAEKYRNEREREEFVQGMREDLDQLHVISGAGMTEVTKEQR